MEVQMFKLAGALSLFLVGCAAGGVGANRESASHATPRFEVSATEGKPTFPVAQDPQLPSADQIRRQIRQELGEMASADVRLCVSPDGHLRKVELVRSSSLPDFDEAVLRDINEWQFSGTPGASRDESVQRCEIARISYRPHP